MIPTSYKVNKIYFQTVPSSNKHGRKRPYTEQNDDLHVPVLRPYITVSYTEKYGACTSVNRQLIRRTR